MGEREDLIRGVERFAKRLSKELKVAKVTVFGSRISGTYDEYSDVDLIIVSPEFRGKKFRERALGFYKYWDLDYPVDFLCFTPEEYEEKKKGITIVREAIKEGVEV